MSDLNFVEQTFGEPVDFLGRVVVATMKSALNRLHDAPADWIEQCRHQQCRASDEERTLLTDDLGWQPNRSEPYTTAMVAATSTKPTVRLMSRSISKSR